MNIKFKPLICALAILIFSSISNAQPLPIYLNTSSLDDSLLEKIQSLPFFSEMSNTIFGSPYYFSVRIGNNSTTGGTAAELTSIMLSGSTLGILPVVSNSDITVTYQLWVNRRGYVEYSYTENFSDIDSFWALDSQSGLEPNVLEWALTTVDDLAQKLEEDPKVIALIAKHEKYFAE